VAAMGRWRGNEYLRLMTLMTDDMYLHDCLVLEYAAYTVVYARKLDYS